jgi:cation transport protein ChaC
LSGASAYLERNLQVILSDGRIVEALVYVVDPEHVQYCGGLDLEEQACIIARAEGGMGRNDEYLFKTADQLGELGLHDPELAWLVRRVKAMGI